MKKIAWWNSVCIKNSLPLNICHENNKTPHSNVVEHQRNNARLRNYQRGHSHKLWLITQLLLSILRILFSFTSQLIHLHANPGISFINARPEWILVTSQQCARVYYQPAACLLTSSCQETRAESWLTLCCWSGRVCLRGIVLIHTDFLCRSSQWTGVT